MRVLAKYLSVQLGIGSSMFEEIEDEIVKSFTDDCHTATEYVCVETVNLYFVLFAVHFSTCATAF